MLVGAALAARWSRRVDSNDATVGQIDTKKRPLSLTSVVFLVLAETYQGFSLCREIFAARHGLCFYSSPILACAFSSRIASARDPVELAVFLVRLVA
ncbi:hypothetical protein DSM3645_02378 [Blastopirellula marina DSM 3645]|uniref:Uncharacterized protein n=1 Tax=Blastopirellula marina DSM 3645 TaxID=314230 RepID=A3ZVD9_9BACT|nr:hypothetical protein DSM3645_02378 [Blastopirellula marina DSM 3645]